MCFVYVVLIRKQKLIARQEAPKYAGAAFETAGQFAYIFALSDTAHVAISAPIISAYCVASVVWSRIFLKEKQMCIRDRCTGANAAMVPESRRNWPPVLSALSEAGKSRTCVRPIQRGKGVL